MKLSKTAQKLYELISELPVVDAHEHLPPEKKYLEANYFGLNLFAGGYIWHDLASAGLDLEFKATMRETKFRPVEEWWPKIKPYWEKVQYCSYARALKITVRDLFGLSEINDTTIPQLAKAVKEANTPGLYHRILRKRCHIHWMITCIDQPAFPEDPIIKGITKLEKKSTGSPVEVAEELSRRSGEKVNTLVDAIEVGQKILRDELRQGAIGFKKIAADHKPPSLKAAEKEWQENKFQSSSVVRDLLFDKYLDVAAEADVPVAVHTGYWGDFREVDPKHLLSFARRRQDVRFDLFHLGMPMIRDAIMIAKNLPNVTLNLTWSPIISQTQTIRALDEIIDLVPLNKIIAFGGDYRVAVQNVYGHLLMAREAVAVVLANRIEAGQFDQEEALRIAKMWFYDNPLQIYKLPPPPKDH